MNARKFNSLRVTKQSTSQGPLSPTNARRIYIGAAANLQFIDSTDEEIARKQVAKDGFNIVDELKGYLYFASWRRINGHAARSMFRSLMAIAEYYNQKPESINRAAAQMLLEIEEENA